MPAVVAALAGMLLSACAMSNVNLVNDHRLAFLAPPNRAHLHLPVTLRWEMADFAGVAGGSGGSFAVFVDRAPIRPGQTLSAVAQDDLACRRTPGCPDASYFSARQIYTTKSASLTLDHVDDLADNRQHEQLHEATVILLNGSGHRIGESAWYRDFWLPKAGQA